MNKKLIIAIIILATVGFLGMYTWQKKQALIPVPEQNAGEVASSTGISMNTTADTTTPTATQATQVGTNTVYQDSDWGYSVCYPTSYEIHKNKVSPKDVFFNAELLSITKFINWDYTKGPLPPRFTISIENQSSRIFSDALLYAQNRFSPHGGISLNVKIKHIVLKDISGAEVFLYGNGEEGIIDSRILIFIKGSLVYLIAYNPSSDTDYKKIADSFTFLK